MFIKQNLFSCTKRSSILSTKFVNKSISQILVNENSVLNSIRFFQRFQQNRRNYHQYSKFNSSSFLTKRPELKSQSKNRHILLKSTMMGLMTISDSIKDALLKSEVVPTVIHDKSFSPKGFLMIQYGKHKDVTMGNTLRPEETQERPEIHFTLNIPADSAENFKITQRDRFTLIVTDPDAPTKGDEKWSEYCHYVCRNIQLNTFDSESVDAKTNIGEQLTTSDLKGEDLVPYLGPAPPPKTGLHRYVFLIYKQKPNVIPEAPADRPCWGTGIPGHGAAEYAKKYELELLGVNFFYAKNKEQ